MKKIIDFIKNNKIFCLSLVFTILIFINIVQTIILVKNTYPTTSNFMLLLSTMTLKETLYLFVSIAILYVIKKTNNNYIKLLGFLGSIYLCYKCWLPLSTILLLYILANISIFFNLNF